MAKEEWKISSVQHPHIALSDGDASRVEIIQQRYGEFARGGDQIAKCRDVDLGIFF